MAIPPERWRLFVALELPEAVRESISRVQEVLRGRGLGRLHWVKPEGMHLTLKFLGDVAPEAVSELSRALGKAASGIGEIKLGLSEPGVFDERRPRVVWLGLSGDVERLGSLQRRIEGELAGLGFAEERRPFAPHLTLARVLPEGAMAIKEAIGAAVAETIVPQETFIARDVSLMRSVLRREGALYTRLGLFPLTRCADNNNQ